MMDELKRVVSALAVMVLLVTPFVATLPASADDGTSPRGFFDSLELWLENLMADLVADFFASEAAPTAGAAQSASGCSSPAGGDDEFMGLIIPGG